MIFMGDVKRSTKDRCIWLIYCQVWGMNLAQKQPSQDVAQISLKFLTRNGFVVWCKDSLADKRQAA